MSRLNLPPKRSRRHKRAKAPRAGLLCVALAGVLLACIPRTPFLVWNFTSSAPLGLYVISSGPPRSGELLAIRPAGQFGAELREAGALASNRLLLKPLATRAGDIACRRENVVYINGRDVAVAKSVRADGQPLPAWSGCTRLSSRQILVLSTHAASFDSRYFGPIDAQHVVGVARPVLTFITVPAEAL